MVWFRYINNRFFTCTHGEEKLEEFMADFDAFNANIQFTYESGKKRITFSDLDVALYNGTLVSTVHIKPTDRHQYFHYSSSHPEDTKGTIVFTKFYESVEFVLGERTFDIITSK